MVSTTAAGGGDIAADVQRSSTSFNDCVDTAKSVVDIINGILKLVEWVPSIGELVERINQLLEKMFAKLGEAIEMVKKIFAYVGSPTALRQATWVTSVGTPGNETTSTIVLSSLPSTATWKGEAQQAYAARVNLQKPAADSIYNKCVMIDDELNKFADAIVNFWVAFTVAALAAAVETAAAVVEIVSVWGTLPGVITLLGAIATFITAVGGLIEIAVAADQAASDFVTQVASELGRVTEFPGGSWPRHQA